MDGLTSELASFVAASANASIDEEALGSARRAFIDTIGVTLAGRVEPAVDQLGRLLANGEEAFAFAGERHLTAGDAALLNGMAGHVLDYDDVAQHGHPSVVLVPAILAAGQRIEASGRDLLRAYAVGFEAWAELAWREEDAYHLGSWHPTPALGIIAATAAVAMLHRLEAAETRDALAIAASFASGVIANFGTPLKPLQAGRAAASALEAVRLAAVGIGGAVDALEGDHGLLRGLSPRGSVDARGPVKLRPGHWRLVEQGLSVKRYPVCYASHRAIDGVIALADAHDLQPEDVRSVRVSLGPAPIHTLRYHDPQDGLEARFSLHHNVAAALVDRAVGFAQLNDEFVRRPDVAALYGLTTMVLEHDECPDQPGMARHDRVVIERANGAIVDSGPIRHPRGHAAHPLNDDELEAKFRDCAAHGGYGEAQALLQRLRGLDALANARELAW